MSKITLPQELEEFKPLKQWVLWRLEQRNGKWTKPPVSPITGQGAQSNNPATWGTFDQCARILEQDTAGSFGGIGIMLANGLYGVDLDHCVDPVGRVAEPIAQAIIATADSYSEYSPSGTGIHVLMRGRKPEGTCKQHISEPIDGQNDVVAEMYDGGRYFTVTGRPYGAPKPVQERTAQGAMIHAAIVQAGERLKAKRKPQQTEQAPTQPQQAQQRAQRSAADILTAMFQSQHGAAIQALWRGDMTAHGDDHSKADQALCNHLAYWTNGDPQMMDQLFRQSGLMREKWDSRRGGSTYGANTISNALKGFIPYTGPAISTAADDFAGLDGVQQAPEDIPLFAGAPDENNPKPDTVSGYLSGGMDADIERFKQFTNRRSGFYNLDEAARALYPGLYVLGAISSLGKTTFIHQLSDHLASRGDHVLYFSLEQSRLEMTLKSIARTTATLAAQGYKAPANATGSILRNIDLPRLGAVPAITLRGGYSSPLVQQARQAYSASVGDRMSVVECNFDTTIEAIRDYVERYMKHNNARPVVIIDYLQIIPASDPRHDERRKVDHIVRGLKKLSADNDLLVMVISSLNRSNYLAPLDFESFKESGGIEYTADVVWGLQLSAIHSDLFNKDNKIKEKREAIQRAKAAIPRSVELVCLKNRYGTAGYRCSFDYDPRYDLFVPALDAQQGQNTQNA